MEIEYSCPYCGKVLDESNVISGICPFCHKLFDKPTAKNLLPQSINVNKMTDKVANKVPEWHSYYPSLEDATEEQRRFFIYWAKETRRGNALDLQGNVSYVFAYLYLLIWVFTKTQNIENLITEFRRVESFYGTLPVGKKSKVADYLKAWEKDAYLLVKDYDGYWQCIRNSESHKLSIEEIINFRAKCTNSSFVSSDIFKLLGGVIRLPKFAKENMHQVSQYLDDFLDDFHRRHNKNFVEYFYAQLNSDNLTEDDFSKLKESFPNEKQFVKLKNLHQQYSKSSLIFNNYLFRGVPPPSTITKTVMPMVGFDILTTTKFKEMPFVQMKSIPYIISEAIKNELKRKIKECKK